MKSKRISCGIIQSMTDLDFGGNVNNIEGTVRWLFLFNWKIIAKFKGGKRKKLKYVGVVFFPFSFLFLPCTRGRHFSIIHEGRV